MRFNFLIESLLGQEHRTPERRRRRISLSSKNTNITGFKCQAQR